MILIISGSRDFDDYDLMCQKLKQLEDGLEVVTEVVCGGAKGADSLGKQWADEHDVPVKMMLAQWSKNGKAAGPIRNREMAEYAEALMAFWDGDSPGTKNMINTMRELKKPIHVVTFGEFL
jgi:hypothetical protein